MVKLCVESTEITPSMVWASCASRRSASLRQMAEQVARKTPDRSAFIVRHPRSTQTNTEYLSLTFRDFVNEQEAWVSFLLDEGIRPGDRVLVWLPSGLAFLAATYALMKMGVEVILLDHRFDWKRGRSLVKELSPRYMLGSPNSIASSKSLFGGLSRLKKRITVSSPLQRMGSGTYSSRPLRFNDSNADLIYIETQDNCLPAAARFSQSQLVEMAKLYSDQFSITNSAANLTTGPLLSLLNPARGCGSVSTEGVLGSHYKQDNALVVEAVEHLKVSSMCADAGVWRSVASKCTASKVVLSSLTRILVSGFSVTNEELKAVQEIAPNATVHRVFGVLGCPIVSQRIYRARQDQSEANVGKLLPGILAKIEPLSGGWNSPKPSANFEMGKLLVSGRIIGTGNQNAESNRWIMTPIIGYVCESNQVHCFASASELVRTSYGTFISPRCEQVFSKHPEAKKVALVALKKNGKTRPGLVVETNPEDMPRSAIAKSRFKAELLCIGAQMEETSFVMDIFFTLKFPQTSRSIFGIDRKALSETYSKRIAY